MIENHRSGFVWRVMQRNPHVQRGLAARGFPRRLARGALRRPKRPGRPCGERPRGLARRRRPPAPLSCGRRTRPTPLACAALEARVEALLRQMTLEEKLGQLQQLDGEVDGRFRPEHLELARARAGSARRSTCAEPRT